MTRIGNALVSDTVATDFKDGFVGGEGSSEYPGHILYCTRYSQAYSYPKRQSYSHHRFFINLLQISIKADL